MFVVMDSLFFLLLAISPPKSLNLKKNIKKKLINSTALITNIKVFLAVFFLP